MAILGVVAGARKPLSAYEVHLAVDGENGRIGIATVYRTLALLYEKGLLGRMMSVNQYVYEPVKSSSSSHVVCSKCGKIDDVEDPDLERLKKRVFKESGYAAGNHMVTFYADCHRDECES
jgi:Fur family ferric uptake transcriptional regulator